MKLNLPVGSYVVNARRQKHEPRPGEGQVHEALRAGQFRHHAACPDRRGRPIGRSRSDPTRMSVHAPRGRAAATTYRTLETPPGFALLCIGIETGRTHQIRVHLLSIHHPVVGDARYGGEAWRGLQDPVKRKAVRELGRLALHASALSLDHPVTARPLSLESPMPEELTRLLAVLRRP